MSPYVLRGLPAPEGWGPGQRLGYLASSAGSRSSLLREAGNTRPGCAARGRCRLGSGSLQSALRGGRRRTPPSTICGKAAGYTGCAGSWATVGEWTGWPHSCGGHSQQRDGGGSAPHFGTMVRYGIGQRCPSRVRQLDCLQRQSRRRRQGSSGGTGVGGLAR